MPIERNFQRKWYLFLGSAGEAEKETNFGKNIPYQRPGKTVEHPVMVQIGERKKQKDSFQSPIHKPISTLFVSLSFSLSLMLLLWNSPSDI